MTESWHSCLLPVADASPVAEALTAQLTAAGYAPYDPFPGGAGTPPGLGAMVRLFVAPPAEGWVRVLGQPDEAVLPALSAEIGAPLLYGSLSVEGGGWAVFRDGARHNDPAALEPFLQPGRTLDDVQAALAGQSSPPPASERKGDLPPEMQELAEERGVDPKQAGKLFRRLSGNVLGKLARQGGGSAGQDQAREIFMGGGRDLWHSLDGQRVRAVAELLRLPGNWRDPSWQVVRDAYQVHRLRQRSPRMPLMPGDKEVMQAVPDALDCLPVYMGRA